MILSSKDGVSRSALSVTAGHFVYDKAGSFTGNILVGLFVRVLVKLGSSTNAAKQWALFAACLLMLLAGPAGLCWLNVKRHPQHGDSAQKPMDRGFIALLLLTSASGLALLMLRDTSMMALLLAIHLGIVMALFLTLPYGKFAHGIYRSAALLKWAVEKRQPSELLVED